MPNGAKCRTAPNAERREIPKCAKSRTATKGGTAFVRNGIVRNGVPRTGVRAERRCSRRTVTGPARRSAIQQGVQHLHDHDQQIVQRPIVLWPDSVAAEVRAQVLDCFFGFSAGDFEGVVSIRSSATTEPFADVRADGLRGPSQLTDVQQSPRGPVDQRGDPVGGAPGGVEHVEAAVWHEPTLASRRSECATVPMPSSPFRRTFAASRCSFSPFAPLRLLSPSGISRRSASGAVRHLAPFGILRL